ncbi:hypothetical protein [Mucilaginibacter boryungensis]|uniref:Lipoprotein n=1 Tax=Mucilaginibacter boryungensis TaxID=768480 RepID=A0ABR9XL53_9SPHI|nr:hypothetical protein [Mucilaginibacter boryungensis]MBE9668127.1 hypothetical protein [Mucilaginibacter boryungensis]
MKRTLLALLALPVLASCTTSNANPGPVIKQGLKTTGATYGFPDIIPVDSANKMIGSYLNSINYTGNDSDVRAFTLNASLLRLYLDSLSGSSTITGLKVFLAHRLSYVNSGHANKNCGYSNNGLTLILAGYTSSGEYVYYTNNLVIDNSMACPTNCPPGTAGNPLLP